MSQQPYIGLRPFERQETDIFFGREQHTDELINRLGSTHFLAVVGASGCGKSSLVKTGLIAGLEAGFLASVGTHWKIVEIRPGNQPFAHLAEQLLKELAAELSPHYTTETLERALKQGALSLHELLAQHPLAHAAQLLIICDQFEEIFRYTEQQSTEDEAKNFVSLLLASSKPYPLSPEHRSDTIYVVMTMRSDFLGDCARFVGLAEAINNGLYLTPHLDTEQLRLAIEEPVFVCDGEIEPALVTQLLEDAQNNPDQLPLLQHVLMVMWQLAKKQPVEGLIQLDLATYKKAGALNTALSQHADIVYKEMLSAEQRRIVELLFRSLTEYDENLRDIRRPVLLSKVADLAAVEWQKVAEVVQVFRENERCFLSPKPEVLTPDSLLDISHESLIRQWQRLKDWTQQEAESAALYRRLLDSAKRWRQDQAALLQSPELETALAWKEEFKPTLLWAQRYSMKAPSTLCDDSDFDLLLDYLNESQAAKQREIEAQRLQQQKKIKRARKLATVTFIGLVMVAGLAVWALQERGNAKNALTNVKAAEKRATDLEKKRTHELFDAHLTHASLLAKGEDYAGAKVILEKSYALDNDVSIEAHHARNLLASFTAIKGGEADMVYRGADHVLSAVAISPDGTLLVAAGEQWTLVIFDVQTGAVLQRLQGHATEGVSKFNSVTNITFTPQGDRLISSGDDKQIILWQRQGKKFSLQKQWQAPDYVMAVAISPDGKLLATGGDDNVITLWELPSGNKIRSQYKHAARISENGLAFNASGELLASASYDGSAIIWQVATGKALQVLTGHTGSVYKVAFSADSQILATSGKDKTIRLWDVANGDPLRVLAGHQNSVFAVDFIANGKLLVSGSFDRNIRLWDTSSGVSLRLLQGHEAGIVDITSYGSWLFSASNDGTVRRWSLVLPYQQQIALPSSPGATAIMPNLESVAVGYNNGDLNLYKIGSQQPLWQKQAGHSNKILRLAFNSKGDLLASGSFDNTAKIWRVTSSTQQQSASVNVTLEEQQTLSGHTRGIHAVAFSPNSQTLATASYDGSIGLFPLSGEQKPSFITAHTNCEPNGCAEAVSFNSDGTHLLSNGYADRSLKLWDLTHQPPTLLIEFPKANNKLLWSNLSPNDQWLASVGRAHIVDVYNREIQQGSRLVGHESTVYKAIFSPDSQQLATVSADATVKFWNLTKSNELFSLRIPTKAYPPVPMWDFDFRCQQADCRLAIPLTNKNLMFYSLSYEGKPNPTDAEQKRGLLTLWQDYLDQTETLIQQNTLHAAKQALTEANSIGKPLIAIYPDDALVQQTALRGYKQSAQLQ